MFLEISGLQQVGKTTLIKELPSSFLTYKFPFTDSYKDLKIKDEWDFCQTKDITMLDISEKLNIDVISDRGPLSSVFYCLLRDKCSKNEAKKFLGLALNKYPNWRTIWVWTDNNDDIGKRARNDTYDSLEDFDKSHLKFVENYIFDIVQQNRAIYTFYNNFKEPINENINNFQKLIEGVKNEKCF